MHNNECSYISSTSFSLTWFDCLCLTVIHRDRCESDPLYLFFRIICCVNITILYFFNLINSIFYLVKKNKDSLFYLSQFAEKCFRYRNFFAEEIFAQFTLSLILHFAELLFRLFFFRCFLFAVKPFADGPPSQNRC
jgi:hypothetical protein